jgi:hypothetical protein
MDDCKCGCGGQASNGNFLPGHDQKLRTKLEKEVGGVLGLEALVNAAKAYSYSETSVEEFKDAVRRLFAVSNRQ